MGEIKSYSERLFEFIKIDSLSHPAAEQAIIVPAENLGIQYTEEATSEIIEITQGYPYFIQELCSTVWKENKETDLITKDNVLSCVNIANRNLDESFFMVRYDRCTAKQKEFMISMVKCGELPCTIINVAKIMNRKVKSISPFRGQLIDKGLIYASGHGEIDFTVPQFDQFIKRINPNLDISD